MTTMSPLKSYEDIFDPVTIRNVSNHSIGFLCGLLGYILMSLIPLIYRYRDLPWYFILANIGSIIVFTRHFLETSRRIFFTNMPYDTMIKEPGITMFEVLIIVPLVTFSYLWNPDDKLVVTYGKKRSHDAVKEDKDDALFFPALNIDTFHHAHLKSMSWIVGGAFVLWSIFENTTPSRYEIWKYDIDALISSYSTRTIFGISWGIVTTCHCISSYVHWLETRIDSREVTRYLFYASIIRVGCTTLSFNAMAPLGTRFAGIDIPFAGLYFFGETIYDGVELVYHYISTPKAHTYTILELIPFATTLTNAVFAIYLLITNNPIPIVIASALVIEALGEYLTHTFLIDRRIERDICISMPQAKHEIQIYDSDNDSDSDDDVGERL